jgi:transposase-like protein
VNSRNGAVAAAVRVQTRIMRTRHPRPAAIARSAFAGFCFPPDVIVLAVRWYLRFALSYRDIEELLAERGIDVDHVTVYRWVQRFTPLLAEAARPCRHAVGDRWQVDETYVKVAGRWRYVDRAIDQFGQVIEVFMSTRRDAAAARRFFRRAIRTTKVTPIEVVTDRAPAYLTVLDDLLEATWHRTERYANNRVEADHGRLKARLGPMRGLKQERSTSSLSVVSCGVEVLELDAGILGREAPVDPTTGAVAGRLPRRDLPLQRRPVAQAPVQALPGQHGQLDLGHVQPAAVPGGVVQLQPVGQPPGLGRWERRIQRRRRVGVEVVLDQHDPLGIG